MPSTSEQTFGNKLQHGRDLNTALGQIVGYSPDNPDLTVAALGLFLLDVEAANNLVASTGQALSDARRDRRMTYFGDSGTPGLGTLAGRVRD